VGHAGIRGVKWRAPVRCVDGVRALSLGPLECSGDPTTCP
jgi:hypothetical protein